MAKYPTIKAVFDRRHFATTEKLGTVEIYVSYSGKHFFYNTGVRLFINQWNFKKNVCRGYDTAADDNNIIRSLIGMISEKTEMLWKSGNFSIDNLRHSIKQKSEDSDPIQWISEQVELLDRREGTKRHYRTLVDRLKKSHLFNNWGDFNYTNIKKFDNIIRKTGIMQSSIHNYHKRLKPLLAEAVKHGLLDKSPYDMFVSPRGESRNIEYLTDEERDAIEHLNLRGRYELVRDCFIFSCYTGICYTDLTFLRKKHIIEKDGSRYISQNRIKTGNKFITILPDKAYDIFKKYNFALPMKSNTEMNRCLKDIAELACIDKRITMHVARHTFATWALHNKIPLTIVSKTLGHSSVKTTEIYAKVIEDDILDEIKKLNGGCGES